MKLLDTIAGIRILQFDDDSLFYVAPMMIDADGSGESHGDPYFQADTSLRFHGKALNSDIENYIVVPPQIIHGVRGIVLGCQAFVTNPITHLSVPAVVGDIGPHSKLGEGSIALAKAISVPESPISGGCPWPYIIYRIFPGTPAQANGKVYDLQPS